MHRTLARQHSYGPPYFALTPFYHSVLLCLYYSLLFSLSVLLCLLLPFRLTCRPDLSRRRGRGPPHAARSPECGLAGGAPRHGSVPKEEGEEEGGEEGE